MENAFSTPMKNNVLVVGEVLQKNLMGMRNEKWWVMRGGERWSLKPFLGDGEERVVRNPQENLVGETRADSREGFPGDGVHGAED